MNDNNNNYHVIAKFYNWLMGEGKYFVWKRIVEDIVAKYQIQLGKCFDIACGTGRISEFLLDLGFTPIGVDKSSEMLRVAQEKMPQIKFFCSDIRNFTIPEKAKFAVSFYDSLNYLLTDEDMVSMFIAVANHLEVGGYFLFDMNTREHVLVSQKNKPRIFEREDCYIIFRFGGEQRYWHINMDFFVKQLNGLYQLIRENHIERAYDEADLAPLLDKAGFELIETLRENKMYEDGLEHFSRLYFLAKKR